MGGVAVEAADGMGGVTVEEAFDGVSMEALGISMESHVEAD